MTAGQIAEGNKLIAKFMGINKSPDGETLRDGLYIILLDNQNFVTLRKYWDDLNCTSSDFGHVVTVSPGTYMFGEKYLFFHESWDWLRPVVEKAISLNLSTPTFLTQSIETALCQVGIKETWLAVVEFIKWYNKNQKS